MPAQIVDLTEAIAATVGDGDTAALESERDRPPGVRFASGMDQTPAPTEQQLQVLPDLYRRTEKANRGDR